MPCLLMDRQHRQLVISQFPLVVEEVSLAEEAEEAEAEAEENPGFRNKRPIFFVY